MQKQLKTQTTFLLPRFLKVSKRTYNNISLLFILNRWFCLRKRLNNVVWLYSDFLDPTGFKVKNENDVRRKRKSACEKGDTTHTRMEVWRRTATTFYTCLVLIRGFYVFSLWTKGLKNGIKNKSSLSCITHSCNVTCFHYIFYHV